MTAALVISGLLLAAGTAAVLSGLGIRILPGSRPGKPSGSGGSPGFPGSGSLPGGEAWVDLTVDIIKEFEGYEPTPKPDPAGLPTVGYGHLIIEGEILPPFPWSMEEAVTYLIQELFQTYIPNTIDAWERVQSTTFESLPGHAKAALVSYVYNMGPDDLYNASWPNRTGADRKEVYVSYSLDVFGKRWPGLVRRRFIEYKLMTTGDFDLQPPGWRDWYDGHKTG